jgi:2-keto-3-deoxy-6-phosphogluconate aldolase
MSKLFDTYRAFHQQGFIPIFAQDDFDSHKLVEACALAGVAGIEYTLRRSDAHEMIPWVRENFPELLLLAGSTLDDDRLVRHARRTYPQMLTLEEMAAMGVHGFVSMAGWGVESIAHYAPTHLIAPATSTLLESLEAIKAGAHFCKMMGPDLSQVRGSRMPAAFDFCPILVTGGQTQKAIPATIQAGAVTVGSGFDVMLKGMPTEITAKEAAEVIRRYVEITQEAKAERWPRLAAAAEAPAAEWLDALPHYHPFEATA